MVAGDPGFQGSSRLHRPFRRQRRTARNCDSGMRRLGQPPVCDPRLDGYASIAIGVILGIVAIILAREAKGLLIGERADPAVIGRVRDIVAAQRGISAVNHVRTIHTGPDTIFVAISADFDDDMKMGDAETLIEQIEGQLKRSMPELSSIYIRPEKRENA
jgi:divalent metal cation (Fe/Co/Zn/Cd) transporter